MKKPDSEPKEEEKIGTDESTSLGFKENFKEVLDENSDYLSQMFSKLSLNEQQNQEVKLLLKEELKNSVSEIKSDLTKESQETKKDFLTIFGLFASFVTFLSIEVQVFKNKDNVLELIGITSISLSFVMFFALVINDISKDKNEWSDFKKPSYILNMIFAGVGILFLYIGATCSINKVDKAILQVKKDSINILRLQKEIKQHKDQKTKQISSQKNQ